MYDDKNTDLEITLIIIFSASNKKHTKQNKQTNIVCV